MEITEHQAAILKAIVDGKTIQYRNKASCPEGKFSVVTHLTHAMSFLLSPDYEVRIKPDVILVNGIEVPAPEKEAPAHESEYYVPNCSHEECYYTTTWFGSELDKRRLERGVVHLVPQNASVHGKAQLAHKPG